MNQFENELLEAHKKGIDTQVVIDRWMDRETEAYDSDDLNEVIDRIESQLQEEDN